MRLERRAEAALVLNTLIWGSTFVLVKQALRDVSPVLFLALRFTLATVALLVLFRGSLVEPSPQSSMVAWRAAPSRAYFSFPGMRFRPSACNSPPRRNRHF